MALLQIHSETFASMIEVGSGDGDPIVLDDSAEAFSEFLLVLLRSPSLQYREVYLVTNIMLDQTLRVLP